ncbi:uncharacterized protein LOC111058903 isoform X2 [Nilaparvata lugens]|nr:uncharacterized protein LOC111058903 isoform X2 [Nilaparvata lugens]
MISPVGSSIMSSASTIATFSGENGSLTTADPTEWFGGLRKEPSALSDVDSKSEASTSTSSSFEAFKEFARKTSADGEGVSCTCVPYYLCDTNAAILDPQQYQNDNPKVRLEMKNCSNMSPIDVCCLKGDLMITNLQNKSENFGSRPPTHNNSGNNGHSTTELSIKTTSSMSGIETTHLIDSLLRNSNQSEVELSCKCVPYYLCDSDKSILDPDKLRNDNNKTQNIRLEMKNCGNMSVLDVCCLGLTEQERLGRESRQVNIVGSSTKEPARALTTQWNSESENSTDLETTSIDDFDFLIESLRNSSQQDVVLTCTCVPYYRCDPNNIIVPQLRNVNVFPKIRVEMENCSSQSSEVCCWKNATIIVDSKTSGEPADRCGVRNAGGVANQSSAVDSSADYGEFPWVAAILLRIDNRYRYHCAGSVIDRNVILTSAHCVAKRNEYDIKIRVGEWDTRNSEEFFPHQDYFLEKIIIHEEFNPKNVHNDIAILILKKPLNYHIHIGRICLPQFHIKRDQFPANPTCFSTGWGKGSFDSESLLNVVPKKSSLKLVEHDKCQERLRESRLGQYFNLHKSFICAYDNDTCSGDGGSPLMCSFDSEAGVFQLVGMVAWGLGCGYRYPSVYVDVAHFRTWISDQLKLAAINTSLLL